MPHMVWAELGADGRAVRILKCQKLTAAVEHVAFILRMTAVGEIRRQIWERDKKRCTHCGNTVLWSVMNMHERVWRGKGGEVSVCNGTTLCADCHQNSEVAGHGKRKVKWSK